MGTIKIFIEDIYINLIMMCILHRKDFAKLVAETEEELKAHRNMKTTYEPEGYEGLFFIEMLARKMGSSLGEVYSLSEERKEEVLVELIKDIKENYIDNISFDDTLSDIIEFECGVAILDTSDELRIWRYWEECGNVLSKDYPYTHYVLTFQKQELDDDFCYIVSISGSSSFKSDFVYDNYVVWVGKSGTIVDFINEVIERKQDKKVSDTKDEVEKTKEDVKVDEKIAVEKKEIESEANYDGFKVVDELVKYVFDTTKTIDLLDTFEGLGQINSVKYKRIVIKNCKYRNYSVNHDVGFNLVIERGQNIDYVGNITFTQFKKDETNDLARYIESEVTEEIINKYIDTNRFYRFSKPYLLRAQNSSNRTGYGWEWDWSGGYGDYTEGTLYGETTNYYFVGVYISSSSTYNPEERKLFIPEYKMEVVYNQGLKIIFYEGKLKTLIDKKMVQRFLQIDTDKGVIYLPGAYDMELNEIYMPAEGCKKYRKLLEHGKFEFKRTFVD